MRHLLALPALLPLLLTAIALADEPTTFRATVAARAAPRLDDLAARAAPDRRDDAATESFWDLLKLRDNPNPAAVPALAQILDAHADSSRIHRFAAAQALLSIGTPDALRALERDVARPEYPVDLAVGYTAHWEMPEPARARLLERYLLRDAGDKALGVAVAPAWRDRDGRRVLAVTVTLTNRSANPLAVLLDVNDMARRLYFRSPRGTFATAGVMPKSAPQPPRWVRLAPGASERFEKAFEPAREAGELRRFGANPPAVVLCEGGGGAAFGLGEPGRYQVYAMVAQAPVTADQIKTLRAWAREIAAGDPKDLWTGRAVSEPADVEVGPADGAAAR